MIFAGILFCLGIGAMMSHETLAGLACLALALRILYKAFPESPKPAKPTKKDNPRPAVPAPFKPDDTLIWVVTEGVKQYVSQHRSERLIHGYYYRYIGPDGELKTTFSTSNHTPYPLGSQEDWDRFKTKLEYKLKTEVGIIGCRIEVGPAILGENCNKDERAIWVGGAWRL